MQRGRSQSESGLNDVAKQKISRQQTKKAEKEEET